MSEQTNTAEAVEERKRVIEANFNNLVDVKDIKFTFKAKVHEETGVKSKRAPLELQLPVPSVEGVIVIMQAGGKGLDLLLEAVQDVIEARAREIINEDGEEQLTAATFPVDKLAWEAIANLPKAERRGGGIAKETWEEWAQDYVATMPQATGKTEAQVTAAAKIFLNKFNTVKTDKPVLKLLKEQITIYAVQSPNAETYSDCISFLTDKADALINMEASSLLNNL